MADIQAAGISAPMICPFCGNPTDPGAEREAAASCSACSADWRRDRNIVFWRGASDRCDSVGLEAVKPRSFRARLSRALAEPNLFIDYFRAKLSNFHPLQGKFSPLAWLAKRKIEDYYERTLTDSALANEWRDGFMGGLQLPPNPRVLDHGCGRGRMSALAKQNGCIVSAQDIAPHPWWSRIDFETAQVVPPEAQRLPWSDASFDMVFDVGVIGHFEMNSLLGLAAEVRRILVRQGYWIIVEANSEGFGASGPRKHYGRLHTLNQFIDIAEKSGFSVVDIDYEGYRSPILPQVFAYIGQILWPGRLNLTDRTSFFTKLTPPRKRYLWRLRLQLN